MDDNFILDIDSDKEKFKFDSKNNELIQIGELDIKGNDCIKRVYSEEGISPTLTTMEGGNRQPKILEDFYKNRDIREYEDYSPTLRSERQGLKVLEDNDLQIRKLTPKECWRLMGFSDEHFDKAKAIGISDSSLYKQAGNSIVVNVLYYIFKNLFKDYII